MDWYFWALVVGAVVASLLSWNIPRAQLWISMLAASFALSSIWHGVGLPYGAAFGVATNLIISALLYWKADEEWEFRVWNCLHLMIVIDVLYMLGFIQSHFNYAVGLELANWLTLIVIGGRGASERVRGGHPARPDQHRRPSLLHRALYAKRTHPPFWEVW